MKVILKGYIAFRGKQMYIEITTTYAKDQTSDARQPN